jgi:C1A family cysteine protease
LSKFKGGTNLKRSGKRKLPLMAALLIIFGLIFAVQLVPLSVNADTIGAKPSEYKPVTVIDTTQTTNSSGYIPSPLKVKKSSSINRNNLLKSSGLPTKYDLRDYANVTEVKNQWEVNDCWAFAAYGSLESVAKKNTGIEYDFSEINMAVYNGETTPDEGGNNYIAAAYLTAWKGPVLEIEDPNPANTDYIGFGREIDPSFHVQDIIFLPSRESSLDNNEIKNAIVTYGAVSSSYYHDDYFYDDFGQAAYYSPYETYGNHAITIIGWDDSFSRDNFYIEPPADGAFLVKNSWGSEWGDNGYFYISYYDGALGYESNAVFNGIESPTNYKEMYSHNARVPNSWYESNLFGGNRYTAKSDEDLSAVGFYTFNQNVYYEVWIDKLSDSQLKAPTQRITSGVLQNGGYHTIKLPQEVKLKKGEEFMVWIKLEGDFVYGYNDMFLAGNKSYFSENGEVYVSELSFGINAYTEAYDNSENLWIDYETPQDGVLYPSDTINLMFSDYISEGIDYSKISLKDEKGMELDKSVIISGNSLSIKELPKSHINGRLKLFIPKTALKNTYGKCMYEDYIKEFVVYADPNDIVTFKDINLEKVIREELYKPTGNITAVEMRTIVNLYARSRNIVDLSGLEYALNLQSLDLEFNNIESLEPLVALENLTGLYISYNKLEDIVPLKNLKKLEYLYSDGNHIRDISPLAGLHMLRFLSMQSNYISDLTVFQNLYSILYINISNNLVKDISPLEFMVKNYQGANISLSDNYIDFTEGSKASNTMKLMAGHGFTLYGSDNQSTELEVYSINDNLYYSGISVFVRTGDKLVFKFIEPITLSTNAVNLIFLKGKETGIRYNVGIEVSDNTLTITPLSNISKDIKLYLDIQPGAVLCKYNTDIISGGSQIEIYRNNGIYGDINYDNKVDIYDLEILTFSYNDEIISSPNWDAIKDQNYDGIIDIFDIAAVSAEMD